MSALAALLLAAPFAAAQQGGGDENVDQSRARQRAVEILVDAGLGDDPSLRSNAIEGLGPLPKRAKPLTAKGLSDKNAGVRFAAAVSAAMHGFRSLKPQIKPLMQDKNRSVRAAALYAMHKLGGEVNLTPLAGMLQSDNPTLRSNVAMLLGLLGDESAVPMLQRAAKTPMRRVAAAQEAVADIQIAEAIARLGEDSALDALRAGAYSQFGEVRVLAVTAMGAVGDKRMAPALRRLLEANPVELRLAAAGALARMGSSEGRAQVLKERDHKNPAARSQAAWALGWFDDARTFQALRRMMSDDSAQVRVAAAAAMLRRLVGEQAGGS